MISTAIYRQALRFVSLLADHHLPSILIFPARRSVTGHSLFHDSCFTDIMLHLSRAFLAYIPSIRSQAYGKDLSLLSLHHYSRCSTASLDTPEYVAFLAVFVFDVHAWVGTVGVRSRDYSTYTSLRRSLWCQSIELTNAYPYHHTHCTMLV